MATQVDTVPDYAALRTYSGPAQVLYVTDSTNVKSNQGRRHFPVRSKRQQQ